MTASVRLGVVVVDQAVSGGSNILAAIVAARVLDAGTFGLFGIVMLVFGLVQGVFRAAVCTPLLMSPPKADDDIGVVVGATWLYGAGSAGLLLLAAFAGSLINGAFTGGLIALAACIPLILIQDLSRFIAIGVLRPAWALWFDAAWLVLFVVGAVVLLRGEVGLVEMLLVWLGTGAITGIAALVLWTPMRHATDGRKWLARNWHLSWRFTGAFGAAQLSSIVLAFFVRALLSASTLAAVLGAQLLMRPYTTVESALLGSGVAEIANDAETGRATVVRHVRRITIAATGVAAINALIMIFLPDAIGVRLLGDTWVHTKEFLLPFGIQLLALGLSVGPRVGLISVGRVHDSFLISVGFIPVLLVATILGALFIGALGSVWILTLVWFCTCGVWWLTFGRSRAKVPA